MGLYDFTIQDIIHKNVLFRPNEVAVVCGADRLTFAEYAKKVNQLAAGLASLGMKKGDRIGVIASNCHEFLILYGAAALLGTIMVPINFRLKAEEIRFILEDCTPRVIVVDSEHLDSIRGLVDQLSFVSRWLVMNDHVAGFCSIHEVTASVSEFHATSVTHLDPFVIIYTAAVDAIPRGAVLMHGNFIASNLQNLSLMGMEGFAVHLNLLPLYHIGGLTAALCTMHAGGRNVMTKKFDAPENVSLIEEHQVTMIQTFPPMLSMLLDQAEKTHRRLNSLRIVAGLDHPETIRRCQDMTGARFWTGFGQTETTSICTFCPYDEQPGSAGKGGPLTRLRVVDEYNQDVQAGQLGEIVVRGPLVFKEYWNKKSETAFTFREGWHHTGDIARLGEKGYVWYLGRKPEKELIKPGGENVYPVEVEKVLREHPDVTETCVFGVPDKQWGEAIKAVCVRKPDSTLTPDKLIEFVASRIARYKKPKYVIFVEDLPKTTEGIIDREKVKVEHGKD
jgi:acyl-CoA synthetase (AMP-forming)/AMP-acid ligase II